MGNFVYKCRNCGHIEESDIREQLIWSCPVCAENESLPYDERLQPLHRYYTPPNVGIVWHEHFNFTTGQVCSDPKQFEEQLHVGSEEVSERLGLKHNFVPVSLNDKDHLGVNDAGMDSTHDRHVELGWKESKGNFVFPMGDRTKPGGVPSPPPSSPDTPSQE